MTNSRRLPDPDPRRWPDDFLATRAQASDYAAAHGIRVAPATLAKLACRNEGPPITYFGRFPHYVIGHFRRWMLEKLSAGGRRRRTKQNEDVQSPATVVGSRNA